MLRRIISAGLLLGIAGSALAQPVLTEDFALIPAQQPFIFYGFSVDLDGTTAVVGSPHQTVSGIQRAGTVFVFEYDGTNWSQQATIDNPEPAADDYFGGSVSISGDTLVVGAPADDPGTNNAGSAFVYTRSGGTWTLQVKLFAPDGTSDDFFGNCVAVEGDWIAVASYRHQHNFISSGSVYLYERNGGSWILRSELLPPHASNNDFFGEDLALDGDTLIIGARGYDFGGQGAAFVYVRSGSTWSLQAKLQEANLQPGERYGTSVALDGDTAIVGAPWLGSPTPGPGSAFVYRRLGGVWFPQDVLVSADPNLAGQFAQSLHLRGDTAIAGAPYVDVPGTNAAGAAYVFTRVGATWSETAKLQLAQPIANSEFGNAVRIHDQTAFVGAHFQFNGGLYGFVLCHGSATSYGSGCAGAGGFVPQLALGGCPEPDTTLTMSVTQGLGGSQALLLIGGGPGDVPLGGGCSLLLNPLLPAQISFPLFGTGPGNGAVDLLAVLPPSAAGASFAIQVAVQDAASPLGFTLTNGVTVVVQ